MDTLFRAKPYITSESKEWILDKFDDILTTGGLIQGKYVAEFEEKIKKLVNSPLNSCSAKKQIK